MLSFKPHCNMLEMPWRMYPASWTDHPLCIAKLHACIVQHRCLRWRSENKFGCSQGIYVHAKGNSRRAENCSREGGGTQARFTTPSLLFHNSQGGGGGRVLGPDLRSPP